MKKKIQNTLAVFILTVFFLCFMINVILQMHIARQDMVSSSLNLFRQVEQIVENSNRELSYIFSLLTDSEDSTLLAVDPDTHEILGSTLPHIVGLNTEVIGIPVEEMHNWEKGFHVTIDNIRTYAVFQKTDSVILGRILSLDDLYRRIHLSNLRLTVYLILIFIAQWIIISSYLERSFVRAITSINDKLKQISDGNLSERISVHTTPEFTELSNHINHMVKKLESELWKDELTQVYNHRGFYAELKELFQDESDLANTAIIMIDSDDLKKTNDGHGHENGDKYLCAITNMLCQIDIPNKVVARLSGDEFAILIPKAKNRETLLACQQQLLDLRDSHYLLLTDGEVLLIRFSLGMSIYGEDGTTYDQLLKAADTRMYKDKMNRKKAPTD